MWMEFTLEGAIPNFMQKYLRIRKLPENLKVWQPMVCPFMPNVAACSISAEPMR